MNVLFVCHGNINRSAAGEIILKKIKPDWNVRSAALKNTKGNEITAKKMRTALEELGYDGKGIRSTPISQDHVDWADPNFAQGNELHKQVIRMLEEALKVYINDNSKSAS